MLELATAAFLMGVVGSLHCIGMCGPFAVMCGSRTSHLAGWQAGKLLTYIGLGFLAGGAVALAPGPVWLAQGVAAGLVIWFGASALGLVPEPGIAAPWVGRVGARFVGGSDVGSRVAFGAINGLLPCGLVYAALGLAVASERPTGGALVMAAFGLGTVPFLTLFAGSTGALATRSPRLRRGLAVAAALAGLWVIARRGGVALVY